MPTPRPKPWNRGITESIRRPSMVKPAAAATSIPSAFILRFVRSIPLLVPVVPPLKSMAAVLSAEGNVSGSVSFLPAAIKSFQRMTFSLSGSSGGFFFSVSGYKMLRGNFNSSCILATIILTGLPRSFTACSTFS